MIAAITLLLACQLAGEILRLLTGIPIPGAIIGMGLLFAWLCLRPGEKPMLQQVSGWLIAHMTIMFLPSTIGVMDEGDILRHQGLAIVLAAVASTLLTITVSAVVFRLVARRIEGGGARP